MPIIEENLLRPAEPATAPTAQERATPATAGKTAQPPESPEWVRAYRALEDLRGTLHRLGLLDTQPAIAHDFVAVLAALDAVRGPEHAEPYWRAQLARLSSKTSPTVGRPGSIYLQQLTGSDRP